MKYLLIAFLILNETSTLCSQEDQIETKLNSFMKIPFGMSYDSVKKLRPNYKSDDKEKVIYCDNCDFGKFKGDIFVTFNSDNQFFNASVTISPNVDDLIFELFDDLVGVIESKYGRSQRQVETFKSPWEDAGRKYPTLSIPTAEVYNMWVFKEEVNDGNKCYINVRITDDFKVKIRYANMTLGEGDMKKREQKQIQDY